ncbi:ATP-grasp domain-containing protein [Pseudoalteromonas sp. R3]|uniref:ATP-grasp domain-containing protein n=1 Tax=Pseudoalteromonas sp. R3 TaxID=1709477 RepID=UPI0006B56601|nr:ATP-grasp domain-containing protein [Pseudoalteromonas sp. R3]AZZ97410.1 ATP-grasp domain-containing protein [Pseudoalteromonas sp. R3]
MSKDNVSKKMRVLLLGTVRPAHKVLKAMGHDIVLFIKLSAALEADVKFGYQGVFCFADNATEDDFLEHAVLLHQHTPFDAVCTYNDDLQLHALKISQALALPFPVSEQTIKQVHNKHLTRALLAEHNIDKTAYHVAEGLSTVEDFVATHGFPVIIKPLAATGSLDVKKIYDQQALDCALEHLTYPFLLEEFLVGEEFSVEAISEDGLPYIVAVTKKYKHPDSFVELGHMVPAPISETQQAQIHQFVSKIIEVVGIQNGPSHTEIILTEQGPRFIETHTRLGGDRIFELVKQATEIDLLTLTIQQSLGQKIASQLPASVTPVRSAAIAFLAPSFTGQFKVEKVENTASLKNDDAVTHFVIMKTEGDIVSHLSSSFERSAFCIVTAKQGEDAYVKAKDTINSLKYLYSAVPQPTDT